jgi:hypothetical protein
MENTLATPNVITKFHAAINRGKISNACGGHFSHNLNNMAGAMYIWPALVTNRGFALVGFIGG